jgi:la-related protein 1
MSGPTGASDQVGPVELDSLRSDTGDEWQVRDFGYGFGHMSGSGARDNDYQGGINAGGKRRVQDRRQKEEQERETSEGPQERPRRGSFNGGYERGGYQAGEAAVQRGDMGEGMGEASPGADTVSTNASHNQYSATPPGQFSHLPPHAAHGYSPDQSVYFLPPPPPPPPPSFGSYHPGGYEVYQYPSFPPPPALYPPVPQPVSQLPFPLDPTRYYLLGQLEYYLSPQNMAQDFYLRQQASSTD